MKKQQASKPTLDQWVQRRKEKSFAYAERRRKEQPWKPPQSPGLRVFVSDAFDGVERSEVVHFCVCYGKGAFTTCMSTSMCIRNLEEMRHWRGVVTALIRDCRKLCRETYERDVNRAAQFMRSV